VQLLVQLADAVARHRGPGDVGRPHRVGVGRLCIEQPLCALFERLAEVGRQRIEDNLFGAEAPYLAEHEEHLRDLVREPTALPEVVFLHQRPRVLHQAPRGFDVAFFSQRERFRALRLHCLGHGEIGPREDFVSQLDHL
jgi:hypothetical protein